MKPCATCEALAINPPKAGTHGIAAAVKVRYCVEHKTPDMVLLVASPRPAPQQPDDAA